MTGLLKNPLWALLIFPFSFLYRISIALKNFLYDRNFSKPARLDIPVISVGNVCAGGTGKTPMVLFIAEYLRKKGINPAIISRGYKRKTSGIVIVSDNKHVIVSSPEECGDEPFLMARKLKDVPVLVDKNRFAAGLYAQKIFNPDIIILDDAFQHRKIYRDSDIVLIDSTNPWGNGSVLPGGPLREPLNSLKRADLIVLSRTNETENIEPVVQKIEKLSTAPITLTRYKVKSWIDIKGKTYNPDYLRHKPVFGFTATGNPESFKKTLKFLNVDLKGFKIYKDHHWFKESDIKTIADKAENLNVGYLVTTEKDMVKLRQSEEFVLPVLAPEIEVDIYKGKNYFEVEMKKRISNKSV